MSGHAHFEVYPRKAAVGGVSAAATESGEFGWRFRAANGQITAIAGEGYTRREDACRAIHDFFAAIHGADADPHPPIIDVDD